MPIVNYAIKLFFIPFYTQNRKYFSVIADFHKFLITKTFIGLNLLPFSSESELLFALRENISLFISGDSSIELPEEFAVDFPVSK